MRGRSTGKEKFENLKADIFDNFSYKIVALVISLILWLSLLNRRDFIATKELDVDIVTAENMVIMGQTSDKLKVKISGPQPLLKKYKETSQVIAFDMSDKNVGFYDIDVSGAKIDVPTGIKILGIKPNTIHVEIVEKPKQNK